MKSQVPAHNDFKEFLKFILFVVFFFALVVLIVLGSSGCGKITVEVTQDEPLEVDRVKSDPVYVIITGNAGIGVAPTLPTGNYFISGNELIIR